MVMLFIAMDICMTVLYYYLMFKNGNYDCIQRISTAVTAASLLGLIATGCSTQLREGDISPQEFSVSSFKYDRALNVGHIVASGTFSKPLAESTAVEAIEVTLNNSRTEFDTYFGNVPQSVRLGDITCVVDGANPATNTYQFDCLAKPAQQNMSA